MVTVSNDIYPGQFRPHWGRSRTPRTQICMYSRCARGKKRTLGGLPHSIDRHKKPLYNFLLPLRACCLHAVCIPTLDTKPRAAHTNVVGCASCVVNALRSHFFKPPAELYCILFCTKGKMRLFETRREGENIAELKLDGLSSL